MVINKTRVLRYTLLPEFMPRIGTLFSSGFVYLSFFMAQIYKGANLLPANHPYLNPANIGRYGIRHVIAEAADRLVFKKENIDQILIFFMLLVDIVVLFMQFVLLLATFVMPIANASPGYGYFFESPPDPQYEHPRYDIAFMLLDKVFGFKDPAIFNSCVAQGTECRLDIASGNPAAALVIPTVPNSFHLGLRELFLFYNYGVLAIGIIIFIYLVVTVVGETAQSGTPFGKRFNRFWAPVRMILAVALLTPLVHNMNGAQLTALYAAKWGSNFATRIWFNFVEDLGGETPMGSSSSLIAQPVGPSFNNIVEFMQMAVACAIVEEILHNRDIHAYQVFPGSAAPVDLGPPKAADFGFWFTAADRAEDNKTQNIIIRFGEESDQYKDMKSNVKPICGEIHIPIVDQRQLAGGLVPSGAWLVQELYYWSLHWLWDDEELYERARNVILRNIQHPQKDPDAAPLPDQNYVRQKKDEYNRYLNGPYTPPFCLIPFICNLPNGMVGIAVSLHRVYAGALSDEYRYYGWAGAGIWYNIIAELNGNLIASIYNLPVPKRYPEIMEQVKQEKLSHDQQTHPLRRYDPALADGTFVEFRGGDEKRNLEIAKILYQIHTYWADAYIESSSNGFIDAILTLFGFQGLLDIHENININPLGQLSALGRSLVESSINRFGWAFGGTVLGGIANWAGNHVIGTAGLTASSFLFQIAFMGLALGFVLYYVIPFLPFIYFFFAVGGWVKGLFEAMVALPLWALALIRIDGDGFPGPAGINGIYLIFEIFVRPFLILTGLLASMIIFIAQAHILQEIWQLVLSNVTGFNPDNVTTGILGRGIGVGPQSGSLSYLTDAISQLFYTVIFTIIIYMMAMSSFKLIDLIPNNILRWMGTSISTFGEHTQDPIGMTVTYSHMGAQQFAGKAQGGINSLMGRLGRDKAMSPLGQVALLGG